MNEQEWLACGDPQAMLSFLEGKVSDRKLRLFACACCRKYWTFNVPESDAAVETAERFADGLATIEELQAAHALITALLGEDPYVVSAFGFDAAIAVTLLPAIEAARAMLRATRVSVRQNLSFADIPEFDTRRAELDAMQADLWDQCELLRHIVGNPFRPVAIDPAWLRWQDGMVGKMAQTIYNANRFDDLPFLADALTDAGCTTEEILTHCRTPMEHPRGCWVVDALLQRS